MPLTIKKTGSKNYGQFMKVLVTAPPGAGKTILSSTAKNPFYASAEGGLMSIADRGIPYVDIRTSNELVAIKNSLDQDPNVREAIFGFPVDTLVVDTIDEVQKILIAERLKSTNQAVMAIQDWGWLAEQMRSLIRSFRNMPLNVIFTVHSKEVSDAETGRVWLKPNLQGAIGDDIPGYVDLSMFIEVYTETVQTDKFLEKVLRRKLLTTPSVRYPFLKDRSGKLPATINIDFVDDFQRISEMIFGDVSDLTDEPEREIETPELSKTSKKKEEKEENLICSECGGQVDKDTAAFSKVRYRKILCKEHYDAQKTTKKEEVTV